jgi:hypothetical protein
LCSIFLKQMDQDYLYDKSVELYEYFKEYTRFYTLPLLHDVSRIHWENLLILCGEKNKSIADPTSNEENK